MKLLRNWYVDTEFMLSFGRVVNSKAIDKEFFSKESQNHRTVSVIYQ